MMELDTLNDFLQESKRYPLLTAEQEIELSKQVEAGLQAEEALKTAIDPKELARLKHTIAIGKRARAKFIQSNIRLVVSVAKKYLDRGMEFKDMIQEGILGLDRAITKFEYKKGYKFSTYAYWWIRQAITRAIADQSRTIRLPIHITEKLNRLRRIQRSLAIELDRKPTNRETAEALAIALFVSDKQRQPTASEKESLLRSAEKRLSELMSYAMPIASLQTKVGDLKDTELGEILAAKEDVDDGLDAIAISDNQKVVRQVINSLTEREREIICLRLGIGCKPLSLTEVGHLLNLSRERVRQIQGKAKRKIESKLYRLKDKIAI